MGQNGLQVTGELLRMKTPGRCRQKKSHHQNFFQLAGHYCVPLNRDQLCLTDFFFLVARELDTSHTLSQFFASLVNVKGRERPVHRLRKHPAEHVSRAAVFLAEEVKEEEPITGCR